MKRFLFALAFILLPHVLFAQQQPVVTWADWTSWGTAFVNPVWGTVEALRGARPGCHLGQLAISGGLAATGAFAGQHFIRSPRPCCPGNGMPSAHAALSVVGLAQPSLARGFSLRMTLGFGSAGATAILRPVSHRHTNTQATLGFLLGIGSEAAGQLLHCD